MAKQDRFKKEYEKKCYSLEFLKRVYIPNNLEECFIELDKLLSDELKSQIKSFRGKRNFFAHHFGPGLWMRNKWGLWKGSRLKLYFKEKGIEHPDDMSAIISLFYVDWLNEINENWQNWEKSTETVWRIDKIVNFFAN